MTRWGGGGVDANTIVFLFLFLFVFFNSQRIPHVLILTDDHKAVDEQMKVPNIGEYTSLHCVLEGVRLPSQTTALFAVQNVTGLLYMQ